MTFFLNLLWQRPEYVSRKLKVNGISIKTMQMQLSRRQDSAGVSRSQCSRAKDPFHLPPVQRSTLESIPRLNTCTDLKSSLITSRAITTQVVHSTRESIVARSHRKLWDGIWSYWDRVFSIYLERVQLCNQEISAYV